MESETYNMFEKLDHFLSRFFNIMALIRTIGVVVVLWSLKR